MSYQLYENQDIKVPAGFTYSAAQLKEKPFYAALFATTCAINVDEAGYTSSFRPLDSLKADSGLDFAGKSDKEAVEMINAHIKEQAEKQREEQATLDDRIEANAAAIEDLAAVIFAE